MKCIFQLPALHLNLEEQFESKHMPALCDAHDHHQRCHCVHDYEGIGSSRWGVAAVVQRKAPVQRDFQAVVREFAAIPQTPYVEDIYNTSTTW